jgi:hypothetical protein
MKKQNCYECEYRRNLIGDAHSKCVNKNAHIKGNNYGIRNGWFIWPYNYDPVWLESCDGFKRKKKL